VGDENKETKNRGKEKGCNQVGSIKTGENRERRKQEKGSRKGGNSQRPKGEKVSDPSSSIKKEGKRNTGRITGETTLTWAFNHRKREIGTVTAKIKDPKVGG